MSAIPLKRMARAIEAKMRVPVTPTDEDAIAALNEFYARDSETCAPFSPQEIERMKAAIVAAQR